MSSVAFGRQEARRQTPRFCEVHARLRSSAGPLKSQSELIMRLRVVSRKADSLTELYQRTRALLFQ